MSFILNISKAHASTEYVCNLYYDTKTQNNNITKNQITLSNKYHVVVMDISAASVLTDLGTIK